MTHVSELYKEDFGAEFRGAVRNLADFSADLNEKLMQKVDAAAAEKSQMVKYNCCNKTWCAPRDGPHWIVCKTCKTLVDSTP